MSELKRTKTLSARLHDDFWVSFQRRTDFVETIKEDMRFYNGDQWPDNNVSNNIRVTDNVIADIIRKIASKINGTPLSFSMTATDNETDCSALQRYDKYVLSLLGHKAFSLQSAINGENLGTEITYYRFDKDAPWFTGAVMDGGLEEEHISPLNFAVANPHCPSIQKQEWVMIWHDAYVGQLKEILKAEPLSDKEYDARLQNLYAEASERSTKPDDQNPDKEILNETLVRVYIRYFRVKKEVCYTMETESCNLLAYPRPLSQACSETLAKKIQEEFDKRAEKDIDPEDDDDRQFRLVDDLEIDFEDTIANLPLKSVTEQDHAEYREIFSLYPFAIFTPKVIDGFIFGRSLTKEMIRMQKGLNYTLSLNLKSVENIAWNKVYVRDGAMKPGETFSSNPEDNIQYDHSKGNGNGFYTVAAPSAPAESFNMPNLLKSEMKDTNGANDFANGQMANQETSGYAVELMLKQANAPLEQEQELFWQYQVELCRIRVMFYKHYCDEAKYTYEYSQVEYHNEENARKALLAGVERGLPVTDPNSQQPISPEAIMDRFGKPTKRMRSATFRRKDIWGKDFDIQIDAQRGLVTSELSTQQWYTDMFAHGGIQSYAENPELLLFVTNTAPDSVMPREYRATMKHYAEEMVHSQVRQLQQQLQQAQVIIQQQAAQMEQMSLMGKEQQAQFKEGINVARKQVQNAQAERNEAQKQYQQLAESQAVRQGEVSEGKIKSNNAKAIHESAYDMTAI